jgi:hypothetical protein
VAWHNNNNNRKERYTGAGPVLDLGSQQFSRSACKATIQKWLGMTDGQIVACVMLLVVGAVLICAVLQQKTFIISFWCKKM